MNQIETIDILLVEDNFNDAELALRVLKKNFPFRKIVHLEDGEQVLDYFNLRQNQPNTYHHSILPKVILLDLKMPKIDGLQVLEILKKDNELKKIPIVVLTSSKEDPDLKRCYELGVNSYIVKPVEFKEFIQIISQIGVYWVNYNQKPN